MDNLPEDQKVVDLLTKLKNSNGSYPKDMLEARRRAYVKQVANAGLGIGIGAALKHTAKGGSNSAGVASTTVASKILEIALIAAIAIEAGTVTYIYRDKIAHAVKSYGSTPVVQEVTAPSDDTASNPAWVEAIGTPSVTPSANPSGTPSGAPVTSMAGNNGETNAGVNANGTPNPNGNNGNQYGLTPKPARTRENNGGGGGNNDGGGNGGNNNGGGHNQP